MELKHAEDMAERLFMEYELDGWSFRFDNALRRFGYCNYRDRAITLSRDLTRRNDPETVRDVLLHEIAHALAGSSAGHGPRWKAQARAIGCSATRCCGEEVVQAPRRYKAECPCGRTYRRDRRIKGVCRCGRKELLQWKPNS